MKGIYIVTNPAFPNYVKIGYSEDIEKRCNSLFNSSVPFPFRLHAVYETSCNLTDKAVHNLIDQLNSDLRVTGNREFYEMTADEAYQVLLGIATASCTTSSLKRIQVTEEEERDNIIAQEIENRHLNNIERASAEVKRIYKELCDYCEALGEDAIGGNTSQYYVCKRNGSNFVGIAVRHNKLVVGLYGLMLEELGISETDELYKDITGIGNFGSRAFVETDISIDKDIDRIKPMIKKCYDALIR